MADDEKLPAEPKPRREPAAICTLMDDGTFRVSVGVSLPQLFLTMQRALQMLFEQLLGRAAVMEQTLGQLRESYSFSDETEQKIDTVLGHRAPTNG